MDDMWQCEACHSLNRLGTSTCYSCGRPQVLTPPLPAPRGAPTAPQEARASGWWRTFSWERMQAIRPTVFLRVIAGSFGAISKTSSSWAQPEPDGVSCPRPNCGRRLRLNSFTLH